MSKQQNTPPSSEKILTNLIRIWCKQKGLKLESIEFTNDGKGKITMKEIKNAS